MKPILLFGTQFTLSLVAYALIALWYVVPWLAKKPREAALVPLVWVHAFRMIGGTVLALILWQLVRSPAAEPTAAKLAAQH